MKSENDLELNTITGKAIMPRKNLADRERSDTSDQLDLVSFAETSDQSGTILTTTPLTTNHLTSPPSAADVTCDGMVDSQPLLNWPERISQKLWQDAGIKPYYRDEHCVIIHGDCRDVLPYLPPVDLVLTDPPYGIKRFQKGSLRFDKINQYPNGILWDKKPAPEVLAAVLDKGKAAIIWGANNFTLPTSEYFLVWDKMQTVNNFASAELAFTNLQVPAQVFRFSIHQHNHNNGQHPTQKPLALMKWCISFAPTATTILDPFMGSGTTLRAAKDLGLSAIGIEIEEKYCAIAVERLRQEVLPLSGMETANADRAGR